MALLPFGDLFYGLREAGLKVTPGDWLGLMKALEEGAIRPDFVDFHRISRALLVKNEAQFDLFDQVFSAVFGSAEMPRPALEAVLAWLEDPKRFDLDPAKLAELEALPLDELRKAFEERLREQKERHDGGSRWVGTGGTSPYGHGGRNPAGIRVGGVGGQRSAIQVASARHFRPYRHDRALDARSMAVALKKLRRLSRDHAELELDVEESIDRTARSAELELHFAPPRKNEARVVLMMDVGGTMDPHAHRVEQLFTAAHQLQHWKRFEAYSFHNCVYESLEPARAVDEGIDTLELIRNRPRKTFLIIVGDASMAPTELLDVFGANFYFHQNRTPGLVWLHRLRRQFPRSVWLNPLRPQWWGGFTTRVIREIFDMYPLTIQGIQDAVDRLLRRPDPIRELTQLFPDLPKLHGAFDE
ncbi:MAG: VWA containing CoxE family protein [Myxococcota bacterium]